jgi:hypothetical protein
MYPSFWLMISKSGKKQNNNFDKKYGSASWLTCRRRLVDTPQTLTQTLPQTLIEQEER